MKREYTYYISTGADTKMYTLRVRYNEMARVEGESFEVTRDEYIRNLSTNKDLAVEKAAEFSTDGVLVSSADELESLEDIRRRESDEIRIAREWAEAEAAAALVQRNTRLIDAIVSGVFPFGKYKGESFSEAPNSYILFWLGMDNEDNDVVVASLKNALSALFPNLANLPTGNGDYIGNVKDRLTFTATLIESFSFEGFYGWVSVRKYVASTGELLTYMGSGNVTGEVGEVATFKATIKKHEEYKGEASTHISRITMAK